MGVKAEVGDAVAGQYAFREEAAGEPFATLAELTVCETQIARDDADLLPIQGDGAVKAPDWGERNVHDLKEYTIIPRAARCSPARSSPAAAPNEALRHKKACIMTIARGEF